MFSNSLMQKLRNNFSSIGAGIAKSYIYIAASLNTYKADAIRKSAAADMLTTKTNVSASHAHCGRGLESRGVSSRHHRGLCSSNEARTQESFSERQSRQSSRLHQRLDLQGFPCKQHLVQEAVRENWFRWQPFVYRGQGSFRLLQSRD